MKTNIGQKKTRKDAQGCRDEGKGRVAHHSTRSQENVGRYITATGFQENVGRYITAAGLSKR